MFPIQIADQKKKDLYLWVQDGVIPVAYLDVIRGIKSTLTRQAEDRFVRETKVSVVDFTKDNDPRENGGHDDRSDEDD